MTTTTPTLSKTETELYKHVRRLAHALRAVPPEKQAELLFFALAEHTDTRTWARAADTAEAVVRGK